jgi:hypothetical protein
MRYEPHLVVEKSHFFPFVSDNVVGVHYVGHLLSLFKSLHDEGKLHHRATEQTFVESAYPKHRASVHAIVPFSKISVFAEQLRSTELN